MTTQSPYESPAPPPTSAAPPLVGTSGDEPRASKITVVRPPVGWIALDLPELWRYRELLFFLAGRDLKIRYRQTVLGVLWAILQPLSIMLIFHVLFGLHMGISRPTLAGVPYAASTFCALVPWQLFSRSLILAGHSIVNNQALVTKVYFPRLLIPLATVIASLVDFALAFAVFLGLLLWYRIVPGLGAIVVLPLALVATMAATAAALWFSALNAIYRDFQYLIPFLLNLLLFATPVVYPAGSILGKLPRWGRVLYCLNPMAGVAEGFRWALLGQGALDGTLLAVSIAMVLALLIAGLYYFRRMERYFADVV